MLWPKVILCLGFFTSHGMEGVFVGSTPADDEIRTTLRIPNDGVVEFIRWQLTLNNDRTFKLELMFGESKPNTRDFKNGGRTLRLNGQYTLADSDGPQPVFDFIISGSAGSLKMVQVNANMLHIIGRDGKLMTGNGGWSYVLNNIKPRQGGNVHYRSRLAVSNFSPEEIYEGRTPCQDIAHEYQLGVSEECFKLKWRLILNRNPETGSPTTYRIRKVVDNVPRDVTGKWRVIEGTASNPRAVVYQLDPDKPETSMFFLAADENILFFVTKELEYFDGNVDQSCALNRRSRNQDVRD